MKDGFYRLTIVKRKSWKVWNRKFDAGNKLLSCCSFVGVNKPIKTH